MRHQPYVQKRCTVGNAQLCRGPRSIPLNSRSVQSDGTKRIDTTVNSNGAALQAPRLHSYSKVINHLLKRFANDEAITEADDAVLRFTQPAGVKP